MVIYDETQEKGTENLKLECCSHEGGGDLCLYLWHPVFLCLDFPIAFLCFESPITFLCLDFPIAFLCFESPAAVASHAYHHNVYVNVNPRRARD